MSDVSPALPAYLAALAPVIADVVAPAAAEIDRTGDFPAPPSTPWARPASSA